MKKYLPGFVPINFKQSGKTILVISLICLLTKFVSYLTHWFNLPNSFLYLGAGLIVLSLYLIFITPQE